MAIFEFLAASAGTRIIASDVCVRILFLRKGFLLCRSLSFLLSSGDFFRFRLTNLNIHQNARDIGTDSFKQVGKQFKSFAFVFLFRLFLSVAAEIDALTEHVELAEVLSPALIQELKQNIAFELCKSFVPDQGDFSS